MSEEKPRQEASNPQRKPAPGDEVEPGTEEGSADDMRCMRRLRPA